MRGENWPIAAKEPCICGTSPRARGKLRPLLENHPSSRNIPACAGKTRVCRRLCMGLPEHPRVRGENGKRGGLGGGQPGTSPRARGKPQDRQEDLARKRNIPACAGKTPSACLKLSRMTEHPRVRGENQGLAAGKHADHGTSPRARGKQFSQGAR